MLFPVSDLLVGRDAPLCVRHDETVRDALVQMMKYGYSQLPIVDADGNLSGIISEQAISRFLYHLDERASLLDLTMDHFQEEIRTLTAGTDLFVALDYLQREYAVVITEGRKPIGILTDYDMSLFFRNFSEGLIDVQDVEVTLRQYIESIFDTPAKMQAALMRTLGADKRDPTKPKLEYEKLSFNDQINIITTDDHWPKFEPFFRPKPFFIQLMESVNQIRNQLAHFRGQLDPLQHDVLRRARNWLSNRPKPKPIHLVKPIDVPLVVSPEGLTIQDVIIGELTSLQTWLAAQAQRISPGYDIQRSFQEIEALIGSELPFAAREHSSWWKNDPFERPQAKAWMQQGWRVESVDFAAQTVNFRRTDTVLYQLFFADLLARLKKARPGVTRANRTSPQNWWDFGAGRSGFAYAWTFTEARKLRVSLEIDTNSQAANKRAFDLLKEQKAQIEQEIGVALDWDRIDNARLSRISTGIPVWVTDPPDKLEEAKVWALATALKFVDTFQSRIRELYLE
jgi:CBS domain-containing protein